MTREKHLSQVLSAETVIITHGAVALKLVIIWGRRGWHSGYSMCSVMKAPV